MQAPAPMQPQAAPQQAPQGPVQPQAATAPQAPAAPQHSPGTPPAPQQASQDGQDPSQGGATPGQFNPQILQAIEQHLQALPLPQKQYLAHYMTPELAIILGIILGPEGFTYFKAFADPRKTLVVQAQTKGHHQGNPVSQSPKGGHVAEQQSANVPIQPQATKPPATTIMGR